MASAARRPNVAWLWNGPASSSHGTGIDRNWATVAAPHAAAPAIPRVTTTRLSRSPATERTASNIPAEVASLYCVSDPATTVAGQVVALGTGGGVTRRADSAPAAVPAGYLV